MPNKTITPSNTNNLDIAIKNANGRRTVYIFDVYGESMDNGSIYNAIPNGSTIHCTKIPKDDWNDQLPNLLNYSCVFVMKDGETYVKSVLSVSDNLDRITLRSLNKNKFFFPDFDIEFEKIEQLYVVDKRVI